MNPPSLTVYPSREDTSMTHTLIELTISTLMWTLIAWLILRVRALDD